MKKLIKNTRNIRVGKVFYYRSKKRTYGGLVLFRQDDYYLIAISEEIVKEGSDICSEDILRSSLYTLAWFSDVERLLPHRLHQIDSIPVVGDYTNRAGLLIDDHGVSISNVGQKATWKHEFCSFVLHDALVKDVLDETSLPITRH